MSEPTAADLAETVERAWVARRTTFELVALLVTFLAVMYGVSWLLFQWSTHTLAATAVFLLIFNFNGRSK